MRCVCPFELLTHEQDCVCAFMLYMITVGLVCVWRKKCGCTLAVSCLYGCMGARDLFYGLVY